MIAQWENLADVFVARSLNSVPQGLLIAGIVWLVLRFLPRQNAKTRFAVWFVALLAVAVLPFAGTFETGLSVSASAAGRGALLTLPDHWGPALLASWLVAAFVAVLRLGFGLLHLRGLLRSCIPVSAAELDPAIGDILANFSSSRSVMVATSEQLSVPAAIGFLKPKIVVPRWALNELTPQELNTVLLHEYAHVERWDGWTNLLQKGLRATFCFHPAVWWIEGRLSLEREMACDDYVLVQTNDPHGYGKCLIALLERTLSPKAFSMVQAAVYRAHEATLRLAQILDANRAKGRRVWKPAVCMVSAFSLLSIFVLPQTRQLVGFAPNEQPAYRDTAALPVTSVSPIVSAAVIPASLHSPGSPVGQELGRKKSHSRVVGRPTNQRRTDDAVVAGTTRIESIHAEAVPVKADETVVPVAQAVLVVRTANQIGPNSWQWTIAIWRVSVVPEQARKVPVISDKT